MRLVSTRFDGTIHRVWTTALPARDPWTVWIPPGTIVREGDGREWSSPYPVIGLFWPNRFYQVFLLLKNSGAEYYCNIIAPPIYNWESEELRFVDLDLDVIVTRDGPFLVDEEEFVSRCASYPAAWIVQARNAQSELMRMAAARGGPFSTLVAATWQRWMETRDGREHTL